MHEITEKLQEIKPAPGHILSSRGGVKVKIEHRTQPQEETQIEEQPELIKEIEGKCGTITILKPSRFKVSFLC